MDGLGGDREDAARRADAADAILLLAAPQSIDAQQGHHVRGHQRRHARHAGQLQRLLEPGRRRVMIALVQGDEGQLPFNPEGLEGLVQRRRRTEMDLLVLRSESCFRPFGAVGDGRAVLAERALIVDRIGKLGGRGQDQRVEGLRIEEHPGRGPGRRGWVRERRQRRAGIRRRLRHLGCGRRARLSGQSTGTRPAGGVRSHQPVRRSHRDGHATRRREDQPQEALHHPPRAVSGDLRSAARRGLEPRAEPSPAGPLAPPRSPLSHPPTDSDTISCQSPGRKPMPILQNASKSSPANKQIQANASAMAYATTSNHRSNRRR